MVNRIYNLFIFLTLILASCSNDEKEIVLDENGKVVCQSVEECLSSYDFESARRFIGDDFDKDRKIKTITIAESKYWADQGDIDKALTVIDESWGVDDYFWSEEDWQSWRYNIIDKGVSTCCEKSEFKQAKGLALKAAEDINVDGFKIGSDTHEQDEDLNLIKAKGPSMQAVLLKKISKYEELLK